MINLKKSIAQKALSLTFLLNIVFILFACSNRYEPPSSIFKPYQLKVSEGFENPIGFYDNKPTFSWKIPIKPTITNKEPSNKEVNYQFRYQIVAASSPELLPDKPDLWDSQIINSEKSTFIAYEGEPLTSRQKVYWQVRVWTDNDTQSNWSEVAFFELGLLSANDWQAKWIEIDEGQPLPLDKFDTPIHIPQYLRTDFSTKQAIKSARLYVTAKGLFEAFINGKRVGNDVLTPGYTPYQKRIETLTYDVTEHLSEGENAIGITLAEGWYAGRFGPKRHWHKKRTITPKAMAQLEIELTDGTRQIVVTNEQWQATQNGPLRRAGLYNGESYDANYELSTEDVMWHQPSFSVGKSKPSWRKVKASEIEPELKLQPKRHFTSKNIQNIAAINLNIQDGKAIYDLGQNIVGVVKTRIPALKGQTLTLRFAEGINADGSIYTKNLGSAAQEDYYTASEDGLVEWQPQFTFHGFRYVEVSGFDERFAPESDWVTGVVQHTDFDIVGHFNSSSPQLNQLQSNIKWGLKGNFLDIPTDCPQRSERLGWTGDALAFAPTSLFIADSHAFWSAWMQSVREEQFDHHGVPVVVPNEVGEIVQAGWSDAAVTIPWDVYWHTGDTRILSENYDMMTRWILYHQGELENGISKMWTVGDWLQPYSTRKDTRRGETDHSLISTAFYAHSLDIVARTAAVLGKHDDAKYYSRLFEEAKHQFQTHFFDEKGQLKVGDPTQTSYLLAMGFNLLDENTMKKATPHLLEQFERTNMHLRTGFLGTPLIAPVLDKVGRTELALELVFKQTYPSWLYSVSQGATTMWERWDGYTKETGFAKKAGSLNHYAYGAIGQWLYNRLAGISPQSAGYKHVRIAPVITDYLSHAEAKYDSPYGKVESTWTLDDEILSINITIPSNIKATVEIPSLIYGKQNNLQVVNTESLSEDVSINGKPINTFTSIKKMPPHNDTILAILELKSGEYKIRVKRQHDSQ